MHLSVERLVSTTALLALVLAVMPQVMTSASPAGQPANGAMEQMSQVLLDLWVIDLVAISVSVDHVALSISTIPFLCILPTYLILSVTDYEALLRTLILTVITFSFIVARYIANSV